MGLIPRGQEEERVGHRPALSKPDRRSPTGSGSAQGQLGLLGEEKRVISTRARIPPREAMLHIPAGGAQRPSSHSSPGSHPQCHFSGRVLPNHHTRTSPSVISCH